MFGYLYESLLADFSFRHFESNASLFECFEHKRNIVIQDTSFNAILLSIR